MSQVRRTDAIQGDVIHVYDDIEEADNQLPQWWLFIFYVTMVFSVGYWVYYHTFNIGELPLQEYASALRAATKNQKEVSGEYLVMLGKTPESVKAGAILFEKNCVVCHEDKGQGKIGPNLTDNQWIHGGAAKDIYKTIAEGIAAKGMPSWRTVLGPAPTEELTAFVLSIRNTNVPGKVAEGTVWTETAE